MEATFKTRLDGGDPGKNTAGGEEAFASGLADRLVPHKGLLDAALEVAGGLAVNPDRKLRMIKERLTENACTIDLSEVHRRETVRLRECWKSPEHKEAVDTFLAKRSPRFR